MRMTNDELKAKRPFVLNLARQFKRRVQQQHLDLDDLIQVGMLACWQASGRYDENGGASFETFVSYRIMGAFVDELRRCDHLTRRARDQVTAGASPVGMLIHEADNEVLALLEDASPALDEQVYYDEILKEVERIDHGDRYRGIMILALFGYKQRELASHYEVSESRISQILIDRREKLAAALT